MDNYDDIEDLNEIDEYMRDILKDRSCEKPVLGSDIPRETQSYLRNDIMNVRYSGGRSAERPNHSEMMLDDTSRDVRGFRTDTDWRKSVPQSFMRARETRVESDRLNDMSIPTGFRNVVAEATNFQRLAAASKSYLQIFSSSKDTVQRGRGHQSQPVSNASKTFSDQKLTELDIANAPRSSAPITFDSILFKSSESQSFMVPQYGRIVAHNRTTDPHKAGQNATTSQEYAAHGDTANKKFTVLLKEITRSRDTTHDYADSGAASVVIAKMVADIYSAQRATDQTTEMGDTIITAATSGVQTYKTDHTNTLIDPAIFKTITESNNGTAVQRTAQLANRNTIQNVTDSTLETRIYTNVKPTKRVRTEVKTEHKVENSKNAPMYKTHFVSPAVLTTNSTDQVAQDNSLSDSVFTSHKKGKKHAHAIREHIITAAPDGGVNERESRIN